MSKQIIAAMLLLMGSVCAGIAQNAHPYLEFVSTTDHSITVRVNAGSQGTPYGFLLRWKQRGAGVHNVTFDGSRCPEFSLLPNGSTTVTIDGVTGSACIVNESPHTMLCGVGMQVSGTLIGIAANISGIAQTLETCP